ncbi:endonuclease/exonuclease/phosphatase family protein [Winogradskyella ursingii]|uniref:endonuclease/exonuclease/phosphatase family protein n=1 Tax=Winogradskyella ursingii TaxID=2686079 RepID=UPI001FE79FB3|nr:endonuclease/exonuclease/phosphatase family protein [Winogradskyella ursingii]
MYKFKASKLVEDSGNFTVMTYNVRLFNEYRWLPNKNVKEDIVDFIYNEQPDILCLQEYTRGKPVRLKGYNRYNATYTKEVKGGQCIYSKFPIVNSGSLEFPNSTNNALFVDVVKNKDTIRVYNVHLQSSGINTKIEALKKESSEHLFKRISSTFKAQQNQAELLLKHMSATNYKTIIAGDFNNTAYSYVYKELRGDYKDAFEEAGNGFGRTYDFKFFPVRIDFILVDEAFEVNAFKTYEKRLSDHYPIKATLKLH